MIKQEMHGKTLGFETELHVGFEILLNALSVKNQIVFDIKIFKNIESCIENTGLVSLHFLFWKSCLLLPRQKKVHILTILDGTLCKGMHSALIL